MLSDEEKKARKKNLVSTFVFKRMNEQEEEKRFFLLHSDVVNNINVFNLFEMYDVLFIRSFYRKYRWVECQSLIHYFFG